MTSLDVNDTAEFLNSVEEHIAVLDARLVLVVLGVGAVRLHDAVHLIDLAVQSTGGDEARQLLVNKGHRNAESIGHVLQLQASVRLQQLVVGEDAHLANVVAIVRLKETIALHELLNPAQHFKEFAVVAFVE